VTGADVIRVADLDDPRLDDYRNVRDRDLRRERDLFLAEGDVVVRVLAERGRYPIRSVLLSERRLAPLADVVERLPAGTPVFVAPQDLLEEVVGFRLHRGVLAAGQRTPVPGPEALLASLPAGPCRVVALEGLTNTDNVGAVFRNAAAFGAAAVLLDDRCCDPLYRKAVRVGAGAPLVIPFSRGGSGPDLVRALQGAGFHVVALSPRPPAADLADLDPPPRLALLLGTEGPGLTAGALAAADVVARLAMADGFDSLNVATASGVALYALSPQTAAGFQ